MTSRTITATAKTSRGELQATATWTGSGYADVRVGHPKCYSVPIVYLSLSDTDRAAVDEALGRAAEVEARKEAARSPLCPGGCGNAEDLCTCPQDEPPILCVQCNAPVEEARRCYAIPTCYACLAPPEPLPVVPWPPNDIGPQGRALVALHDHFGKDADPDFFRRVYEKPTTRAALILSLPEGSPLRLALEDLDAELSR